MQNGRGRSLHYALSKKKLMTGRLLRMKNEPRKLTRLKR